MSFPTQQFPQQMSPEMLAALQNGGAPVPLPPQPTPASAGFAAYVADPQNAQRIANSLIKPNQPILPPNAPQAASEAAAVPTQSPAETPAAPPEVASVSASPTFPSYAEWSAANQDKLARPSIGKGAGAIGNTLQAVAAGLAGAAGGMHGDPSAGLRYVAAQQDYSRSIPDINIGRYKAQVIDPIKAGVDIQNVASNINLHGAQAGKAVAQTAEIPLKQQDFEAKNGLIRDENGLLSIDPKSPFAKNLEAQTLLHTANAEKARILSGIAQNKYTAGTPEYDREMKKIQQTDEKLQIALGNLGLRRENQAALNTGIDPKTGKPFAGAAQIDDGTGNLTTVGARFAKGANQAQQGAAQYNDVHGALDNMEQSARKLAAKTGGTLNTPGVVAALTSARGEHGYTSSLLQNYFKGKNAASLTPEERDYVQSVVAGHENMQGLRKSAGGGATDTQVDRLEQMIPGAQTPNLDSFLGQTGQIRSTADRLAPGVASVAGGMKVRGKGGTPVAPYKAGGEVETQTYNGHTYTRRKGSTDPWQLKKQ